MTKNQAVRLADRWIDECAARWPEFEGAYLSGSILKADPDSPWPITSDVDVVIIVRDGHKIQSPGKLHYQGALLEITLIQKGLFQSLEQILTTHYLAYPLSREDCVLRDPKGWLLPLCREVQKGYMQDRWVRARIHSFFERIRSAFSPFDTMRPYPQLALGWLFPTGISCFPILCADLQNCTVRTRYSAARDVLFQYGLHDFYPKLIRQLIGSTFRPDMARRHLAELEQTFDLAAAASGASRTLPYRSDISLDSKPIAIAGSVRLIAAGKADEAAFWMTATFARCHEILRLDNPKANARRMPAFQAFLSELGADTAEKMQQRGQHLLKFLPDIADVCEKIIYLRKQRD